MGLFTTMGSLASMGTSVFKTVFWLGKGVFGTIGSMAKSKLGKTALIGGGVMALLNRFNNSALNDGPSTGTNQFFKSIGESIQNVLGGAANVVREVAGNTNDAVETLKEETGLNEAAKESEQIDAIVSAFGEPDEPANNDTETEVAMKQTETSETNDVGAEFA